MEILHTGCIQYQRTNGGIALLNFHNKYFHFHMLRDVQRGKHIFRGRSLFDIVGVCIHVHGVPRMDHVHPCRLGHDRMHIMEEGQQVCLR